MAKRGKRKSKSRSYSTRGRGYFNNFDEMFISLEEGFEEALEATAERLCEDMDMIIKENIYNTPEGQTYDRTFEMFDLDGYMTYEIDGLQCTFMIDGDEIETLDARNPEHHGLTSDSGNGYSGEKFLEELINPNHKDFLFNCRKWIEDKYKTYYREECRKRGLSLV